MQEHQLKPNLFCSSLGLSGKCNYRTTKQCTNPNYCKWQRTSDKIEK